MGLILKFIRDNNKHIADTEDADSNYYELYTKAITDGGEFVEIADYGDTFVYMNDGYYIICDCGTNHLYRSYTKQEVYVNKLSAKVGDGCDVEVIISILPHTLLDAFDNKYGLCMLYTNMEWVVYYSFGCEEFVSYTPQRGSSLSIALDNMLAYFYNNHPDVLNW